MKPIESVKVRGSTGVLPVTTFYRWSREIEGINFEFALTEDPRCPTGQARTLAIVEVGTGFNVAALVHHPKSRSKLTMQALPGLKRQEVIKVARSALHNKLSEIGSVVFIQAMAQAQIIAAKQDFDAKDFGPDFNVEA